MSETRRYGLRSLRFKLVLASVVIEAVMLSLLVWNSTRITGDALNNIFQNRVEAFVPLMNVSLAEPLTQRDYATLDERLRHIVQLESLVYVEVRDEFGSIAASHGKIPENAPFDTSFEVHDHVYDQRFDITLAGRVIGDARYGVNVSLLEATVANLRNQSVLMASAVIVLTVLLLATLGTLLTRHLRTLAQASRAIGDGDYGMRVRVAGRDEVADTATAFNTMAEFLERDITKRKQVEVALREGEEILRLFVEHSSASISMLDNDMRYMVVSPRRLSDYDFRGQNIIGRSHYEIFPETPQHRRDIHKRCLAGATEHCDEEPFAHADGRSGWVKWEICPWHKADGGIGGIIIFSELITERKQAELKVAEYAERLDRLSRQLLTAQEAERRRLSLELHDELGQSLTAIKINLQSRGRLKGQSPAEIDAENIRIVENALQQVRRLALALRPSMLDDLGLAPAVRWMAGQTAERGGFAVQFGADFPDTRLAPELETACFRIAQEALTNIARHAQAKRVTIELRHEGDALQMTVQDDGRGFGVAEARKRANAGGSSGMLGMQERAALIGGQLEIESSPGHGTTVRARFPWLAREEAV